MGELSPEATERAIERRNVDYQLTKKRRATRVTAVRVTRREMIERLGGCFSG